MFWDFENSNCQFFGSKILDSKNIFSKLAAVFYENEKNVKFDESI